MLIYTRCEVGWNVHFKLHHITFVIYRYGFYLFKDISIPYYKWKLLKRFNNTHVQLIMKQLLKQIKKIKERYRLLRRGIFLLFLFYQSHAIENDYESSTGVT
jgi:hypothetical protein